VASPFAGPPTVATGGCAFSATITTPHCGQPSTVHIAVDAPGWGTIAFASCDDHAPIARACGELLGEHPYRAECDATDCWAGVA
jgi:hypothetical protein